MTGFWGRQKQHRENLSLLMWAGRLSRTRTGGICECHDASLSSLAVAPLPQGPPRAGRKAARLRYAYPKDLGMG